VRIPREGCINIHASLLPRWRGAQPIQRAILAGDVETGIAIMRMDAGLDTGPVLLEKSAPDPGRRHRRGAHGATRGPGAAAIVEALGTLGTLRPVAQSERGVDLCVQDRQGGGPHRLGTKPDEIVRQVRAFNPGPGGREHAPGKSLKVWRARPWRRTEGWQAVVF
jgi:methionyl-tRNA formyltransferase